MAVDYNPVLQAIESLKDQKTKLLEEKLDFLNQKLMLLGDQYATAINNLTTRMQLMEKFLQDVSQKGQQLLQQQGVNRVVPPSPKLPPSEKPVPPPPTPKLEV